MQVSKDKFRLGLCISSFLTILFPVDCVRIQFYENGDFTGLYYTSNSTLKCNNFPGNGSPFIKSIKTDTCLMTYLDINCKSPYSWKIMPPEDSAGEYRLGSFHICNNEEGGPQLNLDITGYYDIFNPMESPKILESYQNVCNCINVPKYIQLLDEWSVNNHGNELLAYYEPDCSAKKWEPKLLAAGHSLDSRKVYMHQVTDGRTNKRYGIQSFGPNKYSPYFRASCNSTTDSQPTTRTEIPAVTQWDQHSNYFNSNDDRPVEYCKVDSKFLKIMEDGFRKQMEAYDVLLKKISELEQNVAFQKNKN